MSLRPKTVGPKPRCPADRVVSREDSFWSKDVGRVCAVRGAPVGRKGPHGTLEAKEACGAKRATGCKLAAHTIEMKALGKKCKSVSIASLTAVPSQC